MKTTWFRVILFMTLGAAAALAQFSSGSTGADGALNFTTPGTVIFDPAVLGLNAAGDNVFNFTTINIGTGVTVKLTASHVRYKPVVWLASGNVTIAGTLDLSGAPGPVIVAGSPWSTRGPAEPGPGGYPGGLGGVSSQGLTAPQTFGFGPGAETTAPAAGAGYATGGTGCYRSNQTLTGSLYGSVTLTPLLGGSGGGGLPATNGSGGGGGAGGGAIRIVSSTSISVTGSILARGGNGANPNNNAAYDSGAGSGGAIYLVAPAISGSGVIDVGGGVTTDTDPSATGSCKGGMGRILISSNANTLSGAQTGVANSGHLALPPSSAGVASVTVTSINGVAVPANPTGSVAFPDVSFASAGAVTVNISASAVPLGTVVNLTLVPEIGSVVAATCSGLAGTLASSTSTCSATFPSGSSLVYAIASW